MNIKSADIKVFTNQKGPLPLKTQVTPDGNLPEPIFMSGSCVAIDKEQNIGFELYVAGELAGASVIFADNAGERKTTVPVFFDYNIPFVFKDGKIQPVDIELKAISGTKTDENDVFNLSIAV